MEVSSRGVAHRALAVVSAGGAPAINPRHTSPRKNAKKP